MTTAIISIGKIGGSAARHLAADGESVAWPRRTGRTWRRSPTGSDRSRAALVEGAIADGDAVAFAVWPDIMRELVPQYARLLEDKVVVDPSKPIGLRRERSVLRHTGRRTAGWLRGRRAASIARTLRDGVRHIRRGRARRGSRRAVLLYATDDGTAAVTTERLVGAAGFDPLKAGSAADAGRIEVPDGDIFQQGLNRSSPTATKAARRGVRCQHRRLSRQSRSLPS